MDAGEFFVQFFGAERVEFREDGKIDVRFRGIAEGNCKESFHVILDPEDTGEDNCRRLQETMAEKESFESSGWLHQD